MFADSISDYVEGVGAKYLSAVDADPDQSNQHEIGGLPRIGFKQYLGEPSRGNKISFKSRLVYLTDEDEAPVFCEDELTWYGATRKDLARPLEYRLYYKSNVVTALINEGDFFLIAKLKNGELLLVFTPQGGTIEAQLRTVFGIDVVSENFSKGSLKGSDLLLPLRLMLEDIGLVTSEKNNESNQWIDLLTAKFGGQDFPSTSVFSAYARETLKESCDPIGDPDNALMAWMDHEEQLFRIYERHLVQQRLRNGFGFGVAGDDVDEFISYSLSVQNRRKSRVGYAFEGHLEILFKMNGLTFERGKGKGRTTENNSQPDFIFPSFACYRDTNFSSDLLIMLGVKTTCKDRWRQVLAEANRIEKKHLVTLEAAISKNQTEEMSANSLQLVVPYQIHSTYSEGQQIQLQRLIDFVEEVRARNQK